MMRNVQLSHLLSSILLLLSFFLFCFFFAFWLLFVFILKINKLPRDFEKVIVKMKKNECKLLKKLSCSVKTLHDNWNPLLLKTELHECRLKTLTDISQITYQSVSVITQWATGLDRYCRRETARRFMSLNILLSHTRSPKVIRNDTVE